MFVVQSERHGPQYNDAMLVGIYLGYIIVPDYNSSLPARCKAAVFHILPADTSRTGIEHVVTGDECGTGTWTIVSDARKDGQIFLVSEDEFVGIG